MVLEIKLEKLKLQAKSTDDGQFVKVFQREIQGLQRKVTNVKMRLRSMEIKRGGKYSERLSMSLPVCDSSLQQKHNLSLKHSADSESENNKTMEAITETEMSPEMTHEMTHEAAAEIAEVDEDFDPTESILEHKRPIKTLLPNIPVPHAKLRDQYVWTLPVSRWIHPLDKDSLLEGNINGKYPTCLTVNMNIFCRSDQRPLHGCRGRNRN